MRRNWLRTNTLMLMLFVGSSAVLMGVLKNQHDAAPLQAVIRQSGSGDASSRVAAARKLGAFPMEADAAIAALIPLLRDPDDGVRSEAIESVMLYGQRASAAAPALIAVLREDRLARLRRRAAEALGAIGTPAAAPKLIEALEDEDADVRQKAAEAVWHTKAGAPAAIAHLIRHLERDSSEDVRLACLESMVSIGTGRPAPEQEMVARARVRALRGDTSARVRAKAAFLTPRMFEIEIPPLIEALEDPIPSVRLEAARTLAHVGLRDPRAVPALCRAAHTCQDPREFGIWVQEAAWTASNLSPLDDAAIQSALSAILSLLDFRDFEVRLAVIRTLCYISYIGSQRDEPAWREGWATASRNLLARLEDEREDPRLRIVILDGFPYEWSSREVEDLLAALRKVVASKDAAVRTRAVMRLIFGITWEPNPKIRESWQPTPMEREAWRGMVPALMAVFQNHGMGPQRDSWDHVLWRRMVPVLGKALEDPSRDIRCGAARVLDELGPEARPAVDLLRKLASNDPDAEICRFAAHAVASLDLPAKLKDLNPEVRRAAATALGRMGWRSMPAVPDLVTALDDPDPGIRVVVIQALGKIGSDAGAAVPALHRLAAGLGEGAVRSAAEEALKAIVDTPRLR